MKSSLIKIAVLACTVAVCGNVVAGASFSSTSSTSSQPAGAPAGQPAKPTWTDTFASYTTQSAPVMVLRNWWSGKKLATTENNTPSATPAPSLSSTPTTGRTEAEVKHRTAEEAARAAALAAGGQNAAKPVPAVEKRTRMGWLRERYNNSPLVNDGKEIAKTGMGVVGSFAKDTGNFALKGLALGTAGIGLGFGAEALGYTQAAVVTSPIKALAISAVKAVMGKTLLATAALVGSGLAINWYRNLPATPAPSASNAQALSRAGQQPAVPQLKTVTYGGYTFAVSPEQADKLANAAANNNLLCGIQSGSLVFAYNDGILVARIAQGQYTKVA